MSLASSISGQRLAFKPAAAPRSHNTHHLQVVAKESRIGKQLVTVPDKVAVTIDGQLVKVKASGGAAARRRTTSASIQYFQPQIMYNQLAGGSSLPCRIRKIDGHTKKSLRQPFL
jgi:hypothetical protein